MTNEEIIKRRYAEAVKGIKVEWFTTANSQWYDYIINLAEELKITYLIVVFHNQIFNGGFHQYFVNGYGQFAKETIESLIKIRALKKAILLKEAFKKVNVENSTDFFFREKILNKDIKELFIGDDLFGPLSKLDSQYYAQENEDISELLGSYLRNLNNYGTV